MKTKLFMTYVITSLGIGLISAWCQAFCWGLKTYPLGEIDPVMFGVVMNSHLLGSIIGGFVGVGFIAPIAIVLITTAVDED